MKKYLKILSWILGVLIILMGVTNIASSQIGGILLTLAGLIILPPCYKLLKNKIAKYNKKIAIILCLCFSFISFCMIGSANINEANAQSSTNNTIETSDKNNIQNNIVEKNNTTLKNNEANNNLTNNTSISENIIGNQISTTTENTSAVEKNTTKTESKDNKKSQSSKTTNTSSLNNNASTSSKSTNKTKSSSSTTNVSSTSSNSKNKSTSNKTSTLTTQSTTSNSATVYITDTGEKYHKAGCQYLKNSSHAISKSNAISRGYTACSKCKP